MHPDDEDQVAPTSNQDQVDPDPTPLTLGERRCDITFNPSGNEDLNKFKRMCADAIDFMNDRTQNENCSAEIDRCYTEAMTFLETAQMYGVKAITKKIQI